MEIWKSGNRVISRIRSERVGLIGLAFGLGLANTVALIGWGPLHPTDLTWIFGDNATYYSGWALYRHDHHLNFPLPWTDRVGYPVGTSIALLDAIPLVAVLLRPLSPILSEPFQYLGPYAALCFVLQAYFGFSLCRRLFRSYRAFSVVGGVFFLLSAPLTYRASGHTALLSHWLVLAMLDSYFRDPAERPVRWLGRFWILLAVAAATTPYIAAMCFLVALTGVARLRLEHRCGWVRTMYLLAITVGVLLASSASLGVLVSRDAATYWGAGYGIFSFNLNSLVNPMANGSILLPELPLTYAQQYEGYNYLGLGMIALLVVSVARQPQSVLWLTERRLVPLVVLALLCTALAASASVTFGSWTLFTIKLPSAIAPVLEGLRASGRLFWPAYYLIYAAVLSLTFWVWKPRYRVVILAAALAVQLADLTPLRTKVRVLYRNRFESPLKSAAWQELGRKYDNLILIPPFQCGPDTAVGGLYSYVWFGKFAAAERMRLNSYYAARYTNSELYAHCVDLLRTQLDGTLDDRSAYVVTDAVRTVWNLTGMRSHRCQVADGFNLCTPAASSDAVPAEPPPLKAPAYVLGDVLDFTTKDARIRQYLTFGWGERSATGTWTDGPLAMLRLGLAAPLGAARSLILEVDAVPFLERQHQQLDVDVAVNRQKVDQWIFSSAPSTTAQRARIPASVLGGHGELDIELRFLNPTAPSNPGIAAPYSFLGLSVRSLVVRQE